MAMKYADDDNNFDIDDDVDAVDEDEFFDVDVNTHIFNSRHDLFNIINIIFILNIINVIIIGTITSSSLSFSTEAQITGSMNGIGMIAFRYTMCRV